MEQLSKSFIAIAILLFSSFGSAKYDESDCRISSNFSTNSHLACVTCGAQKYFADKPNSTEEIVPSEKWLALLGITTVQYFSLNGTRKNSLAADFDARVDYQKVVISMLRNYGFCKSYVTKERRNKLNRRGQDSEFASDIDSQDWSAHIYPALTGNTNLSADGKNEIAKYFGFHSPGLLEFGQPKAREHMSYLIINHPDPYNPDYSSDKYKFYSKQSTIERRSSFKKRLAIALAPETDISGEKKENIPQIINRGDTSNGLEDCLREIKNLHEGKGSSVMLSFLQSEKENQLFCNSMAKACDIELDFCGKQPAAQPAVAKPAPGIRPAPTARPAPVESPAYEHHVKPRKNLGRGTR